MAQWEGVHYSDHDMLNMQQEAIRRVRQMQQRARQSISGGAPDAGKAGSPSLQPEYAAPAGAAQASGSRESAPQERDSSAISPQRPPAGHSPASPLEQLGNSLGGLGERLGRLVQGGEGERQGLGGLISSVVGENSPAARALEALGLDNERLLLLGLLLILMNEKADRTLLMALVYLLL